MPTPTNQAAWLPPKHAPLRVGPAPYTRPAADEIVVENRAVAINPLDWILQSVGNVIYSWLKYPMVVGTDVAGVVIEVGASVTRFAVGDRVLGMTVGTDKDSNSSARGAFQRYSVVFERLASPIPDSLSFEDASVLPLGVSTAACALFQDDQLGLDYPVAPVGLQADFDKVARANTVTGADAGTEPDAIVASGAAVSAGSAASAAASSARASKGAVVVWGASTSVGSNAVQLATAAGYDVIATASPRNHDYVRSLGASQVFDYNDPSAVSDIVSALAGKRVAGAVAIGTGSSARCADIVHRTEGSKTVALLSTPVSFKGVDEPGGRLRLPLTFMRIGMSQAAFLARTRLSRIRSKFVFGSSLKNNAVSTAIYADFLPAALAAGTYRAAPQAQVVGHGLDALQPALDLQRRGVSARKLVVTL